MELLKNILKSIVVGAIISSISISAVTAIWVPDAWDVYPEEFHKIYKIISTYVSEDMDLKALTFNFKGKVYKPTPIVNGMNLDLLASKFKNDSKNEDVVGWIYIPKTNINLPIVQHPTDNIYYAKRNYEKYENTKKEYGFPGVIWIDTYSNFTCRDNLSENTVLYGHNWENYTNNPKIDDFHDIMFGQLNSFHHFDFAKDRPYIYISTVNENMVFKIFSVFYTENEFQYHLTNPDKHGKIYIIKQALMRSRFRYNSPIYETDKLLTISTCTRAYGKRSDQRFVVMARLLRDDESDEDILPEKYIVENPNHKQPDLKPLGNK